ncbi:hypothetical protein AVEN_187397-1 [Araneus ventricosus]|uniref:Uncharacterized protein n=1 Tax=Araneus ventricosus TaxID=182803 RepID=A0A4Y2M6E1_ARAVE|nr:hypothetical protein AVEN_187397-1 [Araneus ventricosus]
MSRPNRSNRAWSRDTHTLSCQAKQTLSQRKIMASVFWDRHGVLMMMMVHDGRLHATRNHLKCGSLRLNPEKATQSDSKPKDVAC